MFCRETRHFLSWAVVSGSLFFLLPGIGFAEDNLKQDLAAWQTVNLELPVSERWALTSTVQHRFNDNLSQFDTSQLWVGATRQMGQHLALTAGYATMPTYQPETTWEHRVWQQAAYNKPLPFSGWEHVTVTLRTRNEVRFLPGSSLPSDRLRQLVGVIVPLDRHANNDSQWYVTVSNEGFVNLYGLSGGESAGFVENRLQATVGRKLTPNMSIEVGYLNVYNPRNPTPDTMSHAIVTNLNISPQ